MRVMWFTNMPMPAMDKRLGIETRGSGWWMTALLELLKARGDIELGVVTACTRCEDLEFCEDGVEYFVVSQGGIPRIARIARVDGLFEKRRTERCLKKCAAIVNRWKPDLVHFHGTERFYGLIKARNLVSVPAVASIQGLLGPYAKKVFGSLSLREIIAAHRLRELLMGAGLLAQYRQYKRGARDEVKIIRSVEGILGRTDWDRAHTWSLNPQAAYYHVGEVIRGTFREVNWRIGHCHRHRIMVTNSQMPIKGIETVLEAVGILRQTVPDVTLGVAAGLSGKSGYGRFVRRQIRKAGLSDRVELLGYLDADSLAEHLRGSHCFVIASHVENSPNSLCEAMLVGLPCVASFAGGIPSLIEDGQTGLMFPPGDSALLADRILRVFENDDLAVRLGKAARAEAMRRHDPARVVNDLIAAYQDVLADS